MSSEDWHVEYVPSADRRPEADTGEQRPDLAELTYHYDPFPFRVERTEFYGWTKGQKHAFH
jgi:hypothetical protein